MVNVIKGEYKLSYFEELINQSKNIDIIINKSLLIQNNIYSIDCCFDLLQTISKIEIDNFNNIDKLSKGEV